MQFKKFVKGETNDLEKIERDDYIKSMNFLIEDELSAIDGYNKILNLIQAGNHTNKEKIMKDLSYIKRDEEEHIEILKKILKDYFNVIYGNKN